MRSKVLALVITLLIINNYGYAQNSKADSLLNVLKIELEKEKAYDLNKEKKISQLRSHLLSTSSKDFDAYYKLLAQIFDEYRSFKFDSALTYAQRMIHFSKKHKKEDKLNSIQIQLGSILHHSGLYKEAFDVIRQIDTTTLTIPLKSDYLSLRAWLNVSIEEYDNDAYYSPMYKKQAAADFKEAEVISTTDSLETTIKMAFLPDSVRNKKYTPNFFYNFLTRQNLAPHIIAMVATRISSVYTGENRIIFLTLAAINDIRSSTKETLAAFLLSQELFKLNKTNDAYLLIQEAAHNAKFFGSRSHAVQIESMLPLISSKLLDDKQHEKDMLLIGFLIFVIVAVILFFLLVIHRKQMFRIKANEHIIKEKNHELENVNGKLWESSRIKEELIGLFFKTCSTYIETLDKVTRKTQHNIKLGKYSEANAFLNNVHIEKEKSGLYETLDKVFLTLFPNFVASFNELLKKEEQIWPKKGEALNATLRIFALIRLGVNDLETIAKILDYSVSTVYTYKIRVKSKALIPAEDFEKKIMEIKFIDEL
jgi:hypothetical protein